MASKREIIKQAKGMKGAIKKKVARIKELEEGLDKMLISHATLYAEGNRKVAANLNKLSTERDLLLSWDSHSFCHLAHAMTKSLEKAYRLGRVKGAEPRDSHD